MSTPAARAASYDGNGSAYNRRWRTWYIHIADWLIAHPAKSIKECAQALGKPASTIYQITSSDMFREYLAQRRALHAQKHDAALRERLTSVAELGLEIIHEKLTASRTQIPMSTLIESTTGVLDRLGYGKPVGSVNLHVDNSQHATRVEVPASVLSEARDSMRQLEAQKLEEPRREAPASAPEIQDRDHILASSPELGSGRGGRTAPPSRPDRIEDGGASLSKRNTVSLEDFKDYLVLGENN